VRIFDVDELIAEFTHIDENQVHCEEGGGGAEATRIE
jgi:hypothetical protein